MTKLETLLDSLNASQVTLTRDFHLDHGYVGEYAIRGKFGHVYPDGDGYLLCVHTAHKDQDGRWQDGSARRWSTIKAKLTPFCRLQQDGDNDGALHLDHLPTPDEAEVIRDALGIRKRRQMTEEGLAQLEAARGLLNRRLAACASTATPHQASGFKATAPSASPMNFQSHRQGLMP